MNQSSDVLRRGLELIDELTMAGANVNSVDNRGAIPLSYWYTAKYPAFGAVPALSSDSNNSALIRSTLYALVNDKTNLEIPHHHKCLHLQGPSYDPTDTDNVDEIPVRTLFPGGEYPIHRGDEDAELQHFIKLFDRELKKKAVNGTFNRTCKRNFYQFCLGTHFRAGKQSAVNILTLDVLGLIYNELINLDLVKRANDGL